MILLVTTGQPDMDRYRHPNLGRLVQPRHYSSVETTAARGVPWAADNDCYQGLDEPAWLAMIDRLAGLPGCRFCAVPDVVGDHAATLDRWHAYAEEVWKRGMPAAFVLQDGCDAIPGEARAVFVGGTTAFKLGPDARRLVLDAQRRGLWVHMGRVNTLRRIRYAQSIGCDSIDGTNWAKWKRVRLREGLEACANPMERLFADTEPKGAPT